MKNSKATSGETLVINLRPIGKDGFFGLRNQLDTFVEENFKLLYEGAVRLGLNIPEDYYAPERVQIGKTRLHAYIGLKYADGHKYSDEAAPTEAQLRQTVRDLQSLIDEASRSIPAPFTLKVEETRAVDYL